VAAVININSGGWMWPAARSSDLVEIQSYLCSSIILFRI